EGQTPSPDSTSQTPANNDSSSAMSVTTTPPSPSSGGDIQPGESTAMAPSTQPSNGMTGSAIADSSASSSGSAAATKKESASPATQPALVNAEEEFDRLEAEYAQVSLKPLDEQPVAEMLQGYKRLASSDGLPESLRRIAEFKTQVLQSRMDAKDQL